ncbi:STAS domain-containing protein [Streptomyces anthocyanicus]|uniref:STAS domain-containing protein n=1 Tax=Streptomyces anthocyanicus TaxID=68174 RepID=UPI00343318E2
MSDEAEVTVTVVDDVRIVRVAGDYDAEGAETLAHALALPAETGTSGTVVDLAKVTFADSSFLHTLLAAQYRHQTSGIPLVLAEVPPLLRRLLDLTDVARAFTVAQTVPTATETVHARKSSTRRQ